MTRCLSLVLILGLMLIARANPVEEARREIQAHYATYDRAMERNEIQGTVAFRAPDYTYTLVSGNRYSLKEMKERRQGAVKQEQKVRQRSKITKFYLLGDHAIAHVLLHTEWEHPARNSKGVADDLLQDSWIHTKGGWRTSNSIYLSYSATVDGKTEVAKVGYLRTIRERRRPVSLELEIARFVSPGDQTVDLVAALPVGERSYYQQLNRELTQYDTVLHAQSPLENDRFFANLLGLEPQIAILPYKSKNFVRADLDPKDLLAARARSPLSSKKRVLQVLATKPAGIDPSDQQALRESLQRVTATGAGPGDRALLRRVFAKIFEDPEKLTTVLSGPGYYQLMQRRNQKAIEMLKLERKKSSRKLALLYSPSHMTDLESRLRRMGYELESVRFLPAWNLQEPLVKK